MKRPTAARAAIPAILVLTLAAGVIVLWNLRSQGATGEARVLYSDSLFSWSSAVSTVPQVVGEAVPHPETNTWTYAYTLKNGASSTSAIMTFALAPVMSPQNVVTPTHWFKTYGFADRNDALVWSVVDAGTPPVDWDSVSIYSSPFDLQPGDSLTGFSLVSPNGPGMTTYYVQGFHGLALEPDEPDPPSLFDNSVTGTVVGPVGTVGVDERQLRLGAITFASPVPNPSKGLVSIGYYLPSSASVQLATFNAAGRRIRQLVRTSQPAGVHSVSWDGLDDNGHRVGAGVYFYKLRVAGKAVGSRRVVIVP